MKKASPFLTSPARYLLTTHYCPSVSEGIPDRIRDAPCSLPALEHVQVSASNHTKQCSRVNLGFPAPQELPQLSHGVELDVLAGGPHLIFVLQMHGCPTSLLDVGSHESRTLQRISPEGGPHLTPSPQALPPNCPLARISSTDRGSIECVGAPRGNSGGGTARHRSIHAEMHAR